MKVGVIGAGAWGTALAILSARGGNDVTLWCYDTADAKTMQKSRENAFLPGIKLPENITVTDNMADLSGVEVWLIVPPAVYFRETVQKGREFYKNQPVIICTKGMDASGKFMSEILREELGPMEGKIGVLSGPQFAGEVARGEPSGSTIAGGEGVINAARAALAELTLQETDDIRGVEICGAGKNAVAILIGYIDTMGAGENERAMRVTQAWGEMVSLGRANGANTETFLGFCGLGDLFLTATSTTSRNYSAGIALSQGERPNGTIEGISAIKGLSKIAAAQGISMPNLEFLSQLVE
ncbi:MAG: NAD(P)H-dependent glycerol-3-phosphate dehydrogenase [Alphaproteobacteria bacterium]|nr:NAD(P)H-dependent glycerol-3-phosphate dehydrogenase [Alphaproteobacteria bacterium]